MFQNCFFAFILVNSYFLQVISLQPCLILTLFSEMNLFCTINQVKSSDCPFSLIFVLFLAIVTFYPATEIYIKIAISLKYFDGREKINCRYYSIVSPYFILQVVIFLSQQFFLSDENLFFLKSCLDKHKNSISKFFKIFVFQKPLEGFEKIIRPKGII